jgi:uncharacterized protein DUF5335
MSNLRNIPKSEWREFFDRISRALAGRWAEIEVSSLDLGDQVLAEWVPLVGVTYDSQDDLLDVALSSIDHLIRHPRDIVVDETPRGVTSIAVVDADGARQVITLKEPLTLPPVRQPAGG